MKKRLRDWWQDRLRHWMAKRIPVRPEITLNRRNVYILPSASGIRFLLAAALVFVAAINYAASLAFALAFIMVSIFILAILHGFNNLNRLQLSSQPTRPVYCGEQAAFNVVLSRPDDRQYESLELSFPDATVTHIDLTELDRQQAQVFVLANKRGDMKAPLLRISTGFPLGLCRTWSIVDLGMHCLVYPRPVAFAMDQFSSGSGGGDDAAISRDGSEDFYGLRDYASGDSLRQVAWKRVARGQGMQVKQFVDYVDSRVWLDWDMFYGFSTEERLSRLCYCVLKLSKSGSPFGLKIPGVEIAPATGAEHRSRMLRALALYGSA